MGEKKLSKWIVEQQFVFAIDIKGINIWNPCLPTYPLVIVFILWFKSQKPVQYTVLTEEPNPPVSHTMNNLHVEAE